MTPALFLIAVSLMAWGLGEGMFLIFAPIYLRELGASSLLIGSILGVSGAAMSLAHIPAGHLADRIGARSLLWASWTLGLLAGILMALARHLVLFAAGLVLYGFTAFVVAPLNSYVTAARGRLTPGRAMTLISAFYNSGAFVGPLLGGWIGSRFGLHSVYVVAAVIFAFSTLLIFFLREQPASEKDGDPPSPLWGNDRYTRLLLLSFLIMFFTYLPQPLTPHFLTERRGLPLTSIGLLSTLNSLGNTVLSLGLGHLAPHVGLLLTQSAVALFAFLLWRGDNLFWYGLGFFLLGGYRVSRILLSARTRAIVHEAQMGLAYGVIETVNSIPLVIAPPLAGLLYTYRPEAIYLVSLAGVLFTLFLSLRLRIE